MKGLILFGDSVFFGTGANKLENGCGRVLETLLDMPVLIKARKGDSTREGMKRLQTDVLENKGYSHVVLLFGNNDCRLVAVNRPLVDFEEYKNNLSYMVRKIKQAAMAPLISNLQPIDSDIFYKVHPEIKNFVAMNETPYGWHKRYSDICEELARSEKIPLVDIRTSLEKRKNEVLAPDGVHPNNLGHRLIANTIFKTLNSLMK